MPLGMREEQARDEAKDFIARNFKEVNVLVWGIADRVEKFFTGFLTKKETTEKLWKMIEQGLVEHYGNTGKLFVAVNDSGLRVEVHGSLDFVDLTKDPHIDIYLMLGTTNPNAAHQEQEEEKVEQHPADIAAGALMNQKEGPIGHQ